MIAGILTNAFIKATTVYFAGSRGKALTSLTAAGEEPMSDGVSGLEQIAVSPDKALGVTQRKLEEPRS